MATSRPASAPRTSTRRAAAKTPAQAGATQAAVGATPSGTAAPAPGPQATAPAVAPATGNGNGTNDANLVTPRIEHKLLVQGIKEATASFKSAISVEVAVCCAVFAQAGGTNTSAKKELYGIYEEAGYECKVGGEGKDYKTVNRRIGYAATFFDSLQKDSITAIMGEAKDLKAMQALVGHFTTKYNFRSMSDVQSAAGVVPASRQPRQPGSGGGNGGGGSTAIAPPVASVFGASATATPTGTPQGATKPDAGDAGVQAAMAQAGAERTQQNRRESDDPGKYVRHTYEGATIVLPLDMSPSALGELGIKMMHAANQMRGATLDVATLNAEFKELVAAH